MGFTNAGAPAQQFGGALSAQETGGVPLTPGGLLGAPPAGVAFRLYRLITSNGNAESVLLAEPSAAILWAAAGVTGAGLLSYELNGQIVPTAISAYSTSAGVTITLLYDLVPLSEA